MLYDLARTALFQLDAEKSHDMTISFLKNTGNSVLNKLYSQKIESSPVTVMGISFPNLVGLAAGLDKNGECIDAFAAMGFGFVEVGTVTPLPQAGNPKPRMFRLKSKNALINRMGFNNKGVDYLVEQVKASQYKGVLGINIGKNKDTPNEQGKDDYIICMDKVYEHASYITVNISSPNTPGLRSLQHGDALDDLLGSLKEKQTELAKKHDKYVPLVVKIAPDLSDEEVVDFAVSLKKHKIDGVCATNTTLSRDPVKGLPHADEQGGLSGAPLNPKSTEVIGKLAKALDGALPIIGVGGIDSGQSAKNIKDAGADLIQVYSGFIYRGPDLIKEIVNTL